MVKHIVMWKLKNEFNGMNKMELANEMRTQLMALQDSIPELLNIQVGINSLHPEKNYDLVLTTKFENAKGLASYAVHPDHMKVVAFAKQIVVERACVDYEY